LFYSGTQRTGCPGYIPAPFPAWILGIVVGAVLVLGAIIGVFIWFRRRQSNTNVGRAGGIFQSLRSIKRGSGEPRGNGGTRKSTDMEKSGTIQRKNKKAAVLDADMVGGVNIVVSFYIYLSVSQRNVNLLNLFVNEL
jgi:hypothetical protein